MPARITNIRRRVRARRRNARDCAWAGRGPGLVRTLCSRGLRKRADDADKCRVCRVPPVTRVHRHPREGLCRTRRGPGPFYCGRQDAVRRVSDAAICTRDRQLPRSCLRQQTSRDEMLRCHVRDDSSMRESPLWGRPPHATAVHRTRTPCRSLLTHRHKTIGCDKRQAQHACGFPHGSPFPSCTLPAPDVSGEACNWESVPLRCAYSPGPCRAA